MTTEQKKIPFSGINNDDALNVLADGDYLNLLNARLSTSEYGKDMRIENVAGTTAITNNRYPPYGSNQCIGSCVDIENKRLIWFVANTFNDDGIYCYDFTTQQVYAVLYSSQIAGSLNFSKNSRINRNCKVDQGLLYWTDDLNEPKKINIDSGIKLNQPDYVTTAVPYTTLTDSYEITLIRRPPVYPPTIVKNTNLTYVNNFIATNSWEFAWQYIYFDGETSVLSEYSRASLLNLVELGLPQNYNYITCTLSLSEKIPQTARIIRLVAKNSGNTTANVIKTYDKFVDKTPFINHNSGTTAISFDYYGDILGETIDAATVVKPYDVVPLLTQTIETATNRLFLGNNLSGYNTPTKTSLGVSQSSGASSDKRYFKSESSYQLGVVFYDKARRKCGVVSNATSDLITTNLKTFANPLNIVGSQASRGYRYKFYGTPSTGDVITLTLTLTHDSNPPVDYPFPYTVMVGDTLTTIINHFITTIALQPPFNTHSEPDGLKIDSSDVLDIITGTYTITYASPVGTLTLDWTLNNNATLIEIPDWAYYYSIVRTQNLKTRYFIDSYTADANYGTKDATTGVYTYAKTYSTTSIVLALDLTPLNQSGLGYTYNQGDICVLLTTSSVRYKLPVLGVDGTRVLLNVKDLGDLTGLTFIYEIYTPYIRSENEPYYEVGNIYTVTNPTTSSRRYSTLSGSLIGDVFVFQRLYNTTYYFVEAMSPNDLFYQNWYTDAGFVNYITLLGQTRNLHEIRYSNVYLPGTQNNGLSTFEALNYKTVPLGTGSIQKLQLASKTEEQGVIMLSIGSFQTASCYLGEVQVIGASSNAFLAQDTAVIGTINVLKGMFGTTVPETVIEYLGLVFWYDLNNGAIVQYSPNGLEPVSRYKMTSFFQRYARNYLNASPGNLDNINGFHHIPTAINPFTKRLQVTTPGLIYSNYAATLPSYSSVPSYAVNINNYFDIYTELPQTVCFDIIGNRWKESWEFAGEWYDYFDNIMIGWKNGTIYTHETNTTNWNTVYGVQLPMRFCFTANPPLSAVKDIFGVTSEGNVAPDWTVLYANYPWVSITDLTSTDYNDLEGVFYATFFRDRLTPGTGTADQNLYNGNVVKSQTPMVQLEFHQYTSLAYLNFVDILYDISRGQKRIVAK